MHFFSLTWTLLLIGFVLFVLSLAISARKPSGAQMLLMLLGMGDVLASLAHWAFQG